MPPHPSFYRHGAGMALLAPSRRICAVRLRDTTPRHAESTLPMPGMAIEARPRGAGSAGPDESLLRAGSAAVFGDRSPGRIAGSGGLGGISQSGTEEAERGHRLWDLARGIQPGETILCQADGDDNIWHSLAIALGGYRRVEILDERHARKNLKRMAELSQYHPHSGWLDWPHRGIVTGAPIRGHCLGHSPGCVSARCRGRAGLMGWLRHCHRYGLP